MNDEKKARIRELNKLVQKWGDTPTTYYVYSEYDPGCSCCSFNYDFEEFDDLEQALAYAENMEYDRWDVVLIEGKQIN